MQILYINLDHRVDRKERIQRQLEGMGTVERFPAIRNARGMLGCVLSHIQCLKLAKERGWAQVMIVEDDMVWNMPKHDVLQRLQSIESLEFSVAVLGPIFCTLTANAVNDYFVTNTLCQTTTAYICRQAYYDTLIASWEESVQYLVATGNEPVFALDQYWKRLQDRSWLFAYPVICKQTPDYSDIERKDVNYTPHYARQLHITKE